MSDTPRKDHEGPWDGATTALRKELDAANEQLERYRKSIALTDANFRRMQAEHDESGRQNNLMWNALSKIAAPGSKQRRGAAVNVLKGLHDRSEQSCSSDCPAMHAEIAKLTEGLHTRDALIMEQKGAMEGLQNELARANGEAVFFAERLEKQDHQYSHGHPAAAIYRAKRRDLEAALAAVTKQRDEAMALVGEMSTERDALLRERDTPELFDFAKAVVLEAQHQRSRWDSEHDAGKADADWFWLIGYLAGKALHNPGDDSFKRLHRIITVAAAAANWHAAQLGKTNMRPGIETPPEGGL